MENLAETKSRFEAYLKAKFPERKGLAVTDFSRVMGGMSSMSYVFTMTWGESAKPVSQTLVIRMMPEIGPVPPYDIRPQCEALMAVYGKGVPVPKVHWMELDRNVLGHDFFVMEKLEGEVLMNFRGRDPAIVAHLKQEYVEYLARLHNLDWRKFELSVLKPPKTARQHAEKEIERWEWVVDQNQYGPQPILAEAFVWLKRNIPAAARTSLCHGDYTAANIFCHNGHVAAIFDWELTALGDPVSDIGFALQMDDVMRWGFWKDAEFIEAYEKASGIKVSEESFFFWKLLGYVKLAAAGLGAFRTGLESRELEVHQLGVHSVLERRIFSRIAELMGF